MNDILFRLLLGHLFGDYLSQTSWMAESKKTKTFPCICHCLVYTLWVMVFVPEFMPHIGLATDCMMFGLVFFSHYVLDRTKIVEWWIGHLRGKSYSSNEKELPYKVPIKAIVYVTMDNTLHLFMMWAILRLFITG